MDKINFTPLWCKMNFVRPQFKATKKAVGWAGAGWAGVGGAFVPPGTLPLQKQLRIGLPRRQICLATGEGGALLPVCGEGIGRDPKGSAWRLEC